MTLPTSPELKALLVLASLVFIIWIALSRPRIRGRSTKEASSKHGGRLGSKILLAPLIAAVALAEFKHYLFWIVIIIVDALAAFIAYRIWKRRRDRSSRSNSDVQRE